MFHSISSCFFIYGIPFCVHCDTWLKKSESNRVVSQNCRPIWERSRMISPPSLASRGQTHRFWSTWLSWSWCKHDHEILLVVYHCVRFLRFSYFSRVKSCKLRTAATMITQILRRNVEKMKVRDSNLSNLQFPLVTQLRVNSASDYMSPWCWCLGLHRWHQVINDLAYKPCWHDWSPFLATFSWV